MSLEPRLIIQHHYLLNHSDYDCVMYERTAPFVLSGRQRCLAALQMGKASSLVAAICRCFPSPTVRGFELAKSPRALSVLPHPTRSVVHY